MPSLAFAAGAYLVDDGGITEANKLQVENWYSQSNTGETILVTNPGYQLLPNAEFAMQESYSEDSKTVNTVWPQVKYLWHKSENILSSTTIGTNYSTTDQKNYGSYAYSSTTVNVSELADVHFYVGWQNWRHSWHNNKSVDFLNYGIGSQMHLTKTLSFIPELFQSNGASKNGPTRPATQFGLRYFASDFFIFDLIYGHNINGNLQDWTTFGATLTF
jgi:hypothetical protein